MGTTDNLFVLGLISHALSKGEKLFCAFVDFTKAFDYVVRDILWYKLIKLGVRGKILNVVMSMWRQEASLLLTRTGTAVPSRANRGRRAREFPRKFRDKFLANRLLRCTCDNPALASHIFKSPALTFPPMKH